MATDAIKPDKKAPRLIRAMLRAAWCWAVLSILICVAIVEASEGPTIDLWYGQEQAFGRLGRPQPWCNIVGNVSSATGVRALAYVLNGGPRVDLSTGPDDYRLAQAGDFNIDLTCQALGNGRNQVVIEAEAGDAKTSTTTIEVDYTSDRVWPLPYFINWAAVERIDDVAEIVDGKWSVEGNRVRTLAPGYDRLMAFGDRLWGDYEVETSFIVHRIPGGSYGVGIVVHWNGHTDDPVSGRQPKTGWRPVGGIGWYRGGALRIEDGDQDLAMDARVNLDVGVLYMMKMRVATPPQQVPFYQLKMWRADAAEPSEWHLSAPGRPHHPATGAVLLLAHHVDVSFGDVAVSPLGAGPQPMQIRDVQVAMHDTEAVVTWTTSHRATSRVAYGRTPQYADGQVDDDRLVTAHQVTLTELSPETQYYFQVSSISAQGERETAPDDAFATTDGGPRATLGLQALYRFSAGHRDTIVDGVRPRLNLTIGSRQAVTWIDGGGLRFDAPTVAQSDGSARKLWRAMQSSGRLTVEAWTEPAQGLQSEFARMVTMSQDESNRNVTLVQHETGYEVWLRTTATSQNGQLALRADLEMTPPTLQHVVFTRAEDGTTGLYIDGRVVVTSHIDGDFSNWDRMPLALGNEVTGDHPWLGAFHLVAIYDRALSSHEVRQHFWTMPTP